MIDFITEFLKAGESYKKGIKEEDVDPKQLQMGISVEMEHTSNEEIAKKIALDHLTEFPDYYTRLLRMEAEAKRDRILFLLKKELGSSFE